MDQIQRDFTNSVNEFNENFRQKQHEIDELFHDTEDKLEQLKDVDFKAIALEEAREATHELKEKTGLDLGEIIPELKEIDSTEADNADAAFFAEEEARKHLSDIMCLKYHETLTDKAIRLAGYFQDWTGYQKIDPVPDLGIGDALLLYGLGKQAKDGNNNEEAPSFVQIADRLQWNAWKEQKGKSRTQAGREFVDLAKGFLERFHVDYTDPKVEPEKKKYNKCVKDKLAAGYKLEEILEASAEYQLENPYVLENDEQTDGASWGLVTASFKLTAAAGLMYATMI